ncbi:sulfatase-like hydrolase/transferase, partial [Carboxylicivirga sp. M1479]
MKLYWILVSIAISFFFNACNTRQVKSEHKPNVIYILADDLGYADLSCYGQTKFSTPNIDKLAAKGIKFTQHYSGSTVCAPSRSSLMTGQHTGHTFIRGNREHKPEGQYPIRAEDFTIA